MYWKAKLAINKNIVSELNTSLLPNFFNDQAQSLHFKRFYHHCILSLICLLTQKVKLEILLKLHQFSPWPYLNAKLQQRDALGLQNGACRRLKSAQGVEKSGASESRGAPTSWKGWLSGVALLILGRRTGGGASERAGFSRSAQSVFGWRARDSMVRATEQHSPSSAGCRALCSSNISYQLPHS